MRSKFLAVVGVTVLVVLCGGVASAFAQANPSLGEVALKEAERRKALKAATKVLSNADLPKIAPKPAAEGTAAAGTAKPETDEEKQKAAEKAKEDERDEAWWRQRMTALREELRRNEMFASALQTRISSLTNDFSSVDDPYQRARIAEDRQKAMAEMDRVKADIELQKKKISDAEEEARVQGVPPGWVR
jgi:hypothetical protein